MQKIASKESSLHYWLRGDMDKKGAKKLQKQTSVSHSKNSPDVICCTFGVGYDPYFAQKKMDDVGAENLSKITANIQKG